MAGLFWPALAAFLKPHLPVLITLLLFVAAFRAGPEAMSSGLGGIARSLPIVAAYQIAAPLLVLALAALFGLSGSLAVFALVLMLAAPSITGSPNFAILMGHPPEAALRLLMVGTALFPLTVIPVLALLPDLGASAVLGGAARLALVVLVTAGLAVLIRRRFAPVLATELRDRIDGFSAILLAVLVVGLMSAIGPVLQSNPTAFLGWLAFAICANFGAQLLAYSQVRRLLPPDEQAATSMIAGNRNIALFLVALPLEITDTLLVFIGCYQIPMYLTPIVLRRLYGRTY